MNKDDFKKMIGESIEEKLKEILPSILDEYFTSMKSPKSSIVRENHPKQVVEQKTVVGNSEKVPPTKKIQYVKNAVLNDILNETVVKIKQDGQIVSGGPSTMTTSAPSVLDKIEDIPPVVADALTRDYSQLLKLSKAKSSNR